jgi:hypothetical protein
MLLDSRIGKYKEEPLDRRLLILPSTHNTIQEDVKMKKRVIFIDHDDAHDEQ